MITLWVCYLWNSLDFTLMQAQSGLLVCGLGLPRGSLVQANVSCCLCLALGSLTELIGADPIQPGGQGFSGPEAGPSWVSYIECPCSQLLSFPPQNWALQWFPKRGWVG